MHGWVRNALKKGGGTETSAKALGVDEYPVIKTPIMEDNQRKPLSYDQGISQTAGVNPSALPI